jgi:quinol monooxygenase YgiN
VSEVVVVAIVTAAEGKSAQAEALVRTIIPPTHAEDGCITFALHRDLDNPGTLILVERWTSREALDRHLATEHLGAFRAQMPSVAGAPVQVMVMEALPEGDAIKGVLSGA